MALSYITNGTHSTQNGSVLSCTFVAVPSARDKIIAAVAGTRSGTYTVTSSSGIPFTQLTSTLNGNLQFEVWAFDVPSGITMNSFTFTGAGNAQDTNVAAALVFRDGGFGPVVANILTTASTWTTVGNTAPNSPAVTLVSSGDFIISAFGQLAAETTITAPTSWSNATTASTADTRSAAVGIAWKTSETTGGGSFDPAAWTTNVSAVWISATIALTPQTTRPFTWQQWQDHGNLAAWKGVEIVPDGAF